MRAKPGRGVRCYFISIMAVFLCAGAGFAAKIYVDDNAPNDPGAGNPLVSDPLENGTQEHPFDAIQQAIDAAIAGDTVLVADGTYTGTGNRDISFMGKAICVKSANGPLTCSIDCQGTEFDKHRGFVFRNNEIQSSILDGFTIQYGFPAFTNDGEYGIDGGGGILCIKSGPTLRRCILRNNTAGQAGGAYYGFFSESQVTDCEFVQNQTLGTGKSGAAHCFWSRDQFERCQFKSNTAWTGGAIGCEGKGNPIFRQCVIEGNTARVSGGGLYSGSGNPTITECQFISNVAPYGGGAYIDGQCQALFQNCHFRSNSGGQGGGLWTWSWSHPRVEGCIFSDNFADAGGGLYNRSENHGLLIVNSTFYSNLGNRSAAIGCYYSTYLKLVNCSVWNNVTILRSGAVVGDNTTLCFDVANCIFWNNSNPDGMNEGAQIGSILRIANSCVQGWTNTFGGVGNIGQNPMFVHDDVLGTADVDLRLQKGSPCCDSGDNAAMDPNILTDADGLNRFADNPIAPDFSHGDLPSVDMGAYEYHEGLPIIGLSSSEIYYSGAELDPNPRRADPASAKSRPGAYYMGHQRVLSMA
jgi:hypothetical protein